MNNERSTFQFVLSASRRCEFMVSVFQSDTNCLDAFESLKMNLHLQKKIFLVGKVLSCVSITNEMVHLLMAERRGLNSRVVDSQSTALNHLARSAPTVEQFSVSIYDQILSEPSCDRYRRYAFSYTIVVACLFLCVFRN